MNSILITGGSGFIGSNLVPLLMKKGHKVFIYDLKEPRSLAIHSENLEYIQGDIRDAGAMDKALSHANKVVHLAADTRVMDSIANPVFNFETNVLGTFNILEACRKHGIGNIAFASTGGAILGEKDPPINEEMFPTPTSPYGASKLFAEGYLSAYAASYDINFVALRFANVYGPLSYHKGSVVAHFIKQVLQNKPLTVYGDGTQLRDYIYVTDLCQGIINGLETDKPGVYQLGTGKPTSVNEIISILKDVSGREFEVIYKDFRKGEIKNTYCNIAKANENLNFSPQVDIKQGIENTWKWFGENEKDAI